MLTLRVRVDYQTVIHKNKSFDFRRLGTRDVGYFYGAF